MSYRLRRYALGVAAGVLLGAAVAGAARADGNRAGGTGLYLTESAETLPPGALRLGAYAQYLRYDLAVDPEDWDLVPQLAWAPVRNLELVASLPLLHHHVAPEGDDTGIGDGYLGLKYRFFPRFAALGYVTLPFDDDDHGDGGGRTDFGFAGVVSVPLGARLMADLNLGYEFADGDRDDAVFYGLGLSLPVGGRTKLFGEIVGREYGDGRTHDTMQYDLGLRHHVNDRVSLTAGGGAGMRGDYGPEDPALRLFAGLSWQFGGAAEKPVAPAPPAPASVPAPPAPRAAPPAPPAPPPALPAPPPAPAPAPKPAAPPAPPPAPAPAPPPPPAPAPAPAGPSAEEMAAKARLAAAEIGFEYDRATPTPEGERALQQAIADLLKFPGIAFTLEGHADDRGTATYNKALGQRRAEAVMRILVKAGVAFERMKLATQGEMRPKVPKKDAQSRAANRRVVFTGLQ